MNLSNIYKKTLSLFSAELVIGASNFIVVLLLARNLGVENFGFWGLMLLIISYGEAFGRAKVDIASVFVLSEKKYSAVQIISSVNFITVISTLLVLVIFLTLSDLIFNNLFSEFKMSATSYLPLICTIFFVQNFFFNYLYLNLALGKTTKYGLYNMARSLFFLASVVFLLSINQLNIFNLLMSLAISFFILFVVLFLDFHLKHGFSNIPINKLNLTLLKRGMNYYLLGLSSQINFSMILIIASQFLSAASIGIFYTAKSLSDLIYSRLAAAFSGVMYPIVSNMSGGFEKKRELVFNVTIRVFLFFIIIYLILFNFWEEISTLLYGSEFVDITLIINYLGIGSIIYFSSQLLLEYLKGIGKELYASIPHFISIVIQLIFLDFFYGEINILKITYIYCISFIVSSLILVIIFLRVRDDRN